MRNHIFHFATLCFALALSSLPAAEPSLWQPTPFRPIVMHGKVTAVRGWYLRDQPRTAQLLAGGAYVYGEECFTLGSENGEFSVAFPTPLNPIHAKTKTELRFCSAVGYPYPPAPEYRVTGRVRFDGGTLRIDQGPAFQPKDEWQTVDAKLRRFSLGFFFRPAPGATFRFADLRLEARYPEKAAGTIRLPEGGELKCIQLPENADYLTSWSVAMWRGWLWKLTGVALPVKTVKEAQPAPGTLAIVKGETVPGGWRLTVDRNGITLVCGNPNSAVPALFDYLRMGFGVSFYAPDCTAMPPLPVRELAAIRREAKPHFAWISGDSGQHGFNGGIPAGLMNADTGCDNYHLPWPFRDHCLNALLPLEIYAKSHPEYFMQNAAGDRVTEVAPTMSNPCYSNPEVMRLMVENFAILAESQRERLFAGYCSADDMSQCLCPKCVELNGSRKNDTEAKMTFANAAAAELKKRAPGMQFVFTAYLNNLEPPKRVLPKHDNMVATYALGRGNIRCALHHDCELNRKGLDQLRRWSALFGPDRIGLVTYADMRPRPTIRKLAAMLPIARQSLYIFYWRGFSTAIPFVVGRWNLGEDPEKLLKEFEDHYYGAGADGIREVDRIVEEFSAKCRHTKEEIDGEKFVCIWGGDLQTRTQLDRAAFDRIYAALDRALKAAGNDRKARLHIQQEKVRYLVEDLIRFNRAECTSAAELAALARRAGELVRIAREDPETKRVVAWGITGPQLFAASLGLSIPRNAPDWTKVPVVEALLANPEKALAAASEKIPAGYRLTPHAFRGGASPVPFNYQCPERLALPLRRPSIGNNSVSATLRLDQPIAGPTLLAVEGLDDDKPGASSLEVEVNGKRIFSGPVTFEEHDWRSMTFTLPDGLPAGENTIRLTNVTLETPMRSARFADDPAQGAKDPQWGWIGISGVTVYDFTGEFRRYAENDGAKTVWRPMAKAPGRPVGKVTADGNAVAFRGAPTDRWTGIVYIPGPKHERPATAPGMKLRYTVRMKGSGKLNASAWHYGDDGKYLNMQSIVPFAPVPGKEELHTAVIPMPTRSRRFEPALLVRGECDLVISDFSLEIQQ